MKGIGLYEFLQHLIFNQHRNAGDPAQMLSVQRMNLNGFNTLLFRHDNIRNDHISWFFIEINVIPLLIFFILSSSSSLLIRALGPSKA